MLRVEGVEFTEVALQDHPDKAKEFIEQGYTTAPIVATDIEVWSGFSYEKIKSLAQRVSSERVHDSHYSKPLDMDIGEL
jgi:glutaredoxin